MVTVVDSLWQYFITVIMTHDDSPAGAQPKRDIATQLLASEAQFHAIAEAMPQLVFRTTPDGSVDFFNSSWYAFTGFSEGAANGDGWKDALHPDDVERVAAIWDEGRRTEEPCEDEYRLRHHTGEYRWVLTRAQPVKRPDGTVLWWLGTSTDINALKVAEQQRTLMLDEMNHRIKNTLTLVQVIISQTITNANSLEDIDRAVRARISALSIAHDQLINSAWNGADIVEVVDAALKPHRTGRGHFNISGSRLPIGSNRAIALTMALHELATNAAKYGALSSEEGDVDVAWQVDSEDQNFRFVWQESGGPRIANPTRKGFGSKMMEQAVCGYFGGSSKMDYDESGSRFEMISPLSGLKG